MPILRDELLDNTLQEENRDVKLNMEKSERLSFMEDNTRKEFNSSLKRIENTLISAYNQASANYNSFFYNINMLTLPQGTNGGNESGMFQVMKIDKSEQTEEDQLRMKILQGVNTELNDSLRMTLGVVLKTYRELEKIQSKIGDLIQENSELKSEKFELNISIQELKNENNKLSRENFYLNEQIKERISTCDKYKNALNKSIKTMKKLYFENDHFNKEINQLENQLVVSKLRVAQHNEELEHIRTLLKYYKTKVNSDYILSPAIEQIIKVEPCRIPSNNKEIPHCNHKGAGTSCSRSHIGNILSRLLFNNGSATTKNTRKGKKVSLARTSSNNNSPKSSSPCLKFQYNQQPKSGAYYNSSTTTPIKSTKSYIDESSLQSTGTDYCNNDAFSNHQRISKENLLSLDDDKFIESFTSHKALKK